MSTCSRLRQSNTFTGETLERFWLFCDCFVAVLWLFCLTVLWLFCLTDLVRGSYYCFLCCQLWGCMGGWIVDGATALGILAAGNVLLLVYQAPACSANQITILLLQASNYVLQYSALLRWAVLILIYQSRGMYITINVASHPLLRELPPIIVWVIVLVCFFLPGKKLLGSTRHMLQVSHFMIKIYQSLACFTDPFTIVYCCAVHFRPRPVRRILPGQFPRRNVRLNHKITWWFFLSHTTIYA